MPVRCCAGRWTACCFLRCANWAAASARLPDELQFLHWRAGEEPDAHDFEGHLHRIGPDTLVLELEAAPAPLSTGEDETRGRQLLQALGGAVHRFSVCASVEALALCAAQAVRAMTGHHVVQVRAFDATGRGHLLAEDRTDSPTLATVPALHAAGLVPSAEAQHLRQRVRVLVDEQQSGVELVPKRPPDRGAGFDLTRSRLRAASAACARVMSKRGARAALWIAVVREGRLWGLIEA